jgi:hypothetical protein
VKNTGQEPVSKDRSPAHHGFRGSAQIQSVEIDEDRRFNKCRGSRIHNLDNSKSFQDTALAQALAESEVQTELPVFIPGSYQRQIPRNVVFDNDDLLLVCGEVSGEGHHQVF